MTSDYLGDWDGKDNLHLRSFSEISHRTPWEPGALVFNSTYKQLFFPQIYLYSSVVTVIICSIIVGHVASMTPDFTQAKQAANRVFYLLDHVPPIDSYSNEGKQPVSESVIFLERERGGERGRGRERGKKFYINKLWLSWIGKCAIGNLIQVKFPYRKIAWSKGGMVGQEIWPVRYVWPRTVGHVSPHPSHTTRGYLAVNLCYCITSLV